MTEMSLESKPENSLGGRFDEFIQLLETQLLYIIEMTLCFWSINFPK